MFWFRCLAVLELPGAVFFCWDGEGRQREVASVRGVDAVGGVFEVLWVDVVEGRQRKVASLREWMQSGMFLGF